MIITFINVYLFMYYDGELWLHASKVYTFRYDKYDIFFIKDDKHDIVMV